MTTDPAVRPHAHFGDDYSPDRCAWTGLDGTKCDVPLRQSATTTDPAVQAAAEALSIIGGVPDIWDLRAAGIAVAAARPIIEAEVRERIAAEVGAMTLKQIGMGVSLFDAARDQAVRIAMGQS